MTSQDFGREVQLSKLLEPSLNQSLTNPSGLGKLCYQDVLGVSFHSFLLLIINNRKEQLSTVSRKISSLLCNIFFFEINEVLPLPRILINCWQPAKKLATLCTEPPTFPGNRGR